MSKSKKELKVLRNKIERLITYVEVELESPNASGNDDIDKAYDDGFNVAFEDILTKLNSLQGVKDGSNRLNILNAGSNTGIQGCSYACTGWLYINKTYIYR